MDALYAAFRAWLPLAVAVTGLSALLFAATQQVYRQSLNDPQIQMAQDAVLALERGATPSSLVPNVSVDIAESLSPFIVIYDDTARPLASSGTLRDGPMPAPPSGVFDLARAQGDNLPHNTWEPVHDVRIAAVLMHVPKKGGFVLVGRNMRIVEEREGALGASVAAIWLMVMVATFFVQIIVHISVQKHR